MPAPPDPLSDTLHRWKVEPPAGPGFRADVWRRISERAQESWPVYLRSHATAWMAATVLTFGAAAYTGHATAQARIRSDRATLVVSYLVDLDPRVQADLKP